MKHLNSNTGLLLKKLVYLLVIYAVCRVLFFAFNLSFFSDLGFWSFLKILFYGIYFDASTIILLNFAFIVLFLLPFPVREKKIYRALLKWLFVITNSIALLANCADLAYFQFTSKRTTADVFNFFGGEMGNDLGRLLPLFLKDYWYVFIIWAALIYLLITGYKKTGDIRPLEWKPKQYLFQSLILILNFGLAVVINRGGFQLRPIGITNAGEFVESKYVPLVLNTPFSIMKTIEVKGIEPRTYFLHDEDVKKYYNPHHIGHTGEFKKLNVIIIALESFSKEYVGALNPGKESFTPFLDSLIPHSLVFCNAFSNGKKSIEGIPAMVASIPSWSDEPYITSRYGNNNIQSIANLLKAEGYATSFFHGGTNGTMGFDAFAGLAGYEEYYGRKEYNNEKDYDGNWGIWDEEFLQYTANTLNKEPQPFFSTIFTLTSHHPFNIPEKYKDKFREGPMEIHKTIRYSDFSLKKFFESAQKMPWFKNTLFILAADHTGYSQNDFFKNRLGNYTIPMIYYMPVSGLKGMDSTFTQQIDIMPTVLDYLNYPKSYFSFGNSALDSNVSHFAFMYNSGFYELVEDNYISQYSDNTVPDLYYFKTDSMFNNNLADQRREVMVHMINRTRAILQTYERSIINNKMITTAK
jgi:phosphoglycerol transferase MdoB-like AlkP superfamily enzyme